MAGVAVLVRDNPAYSSHLLWAFAALLAFNLAYHVVLRRHGDTWHVPMISMAANMVLATAVLAFSGGADSPFWPMYLLPLFTACLYLDKRHVAFAAAASSAFLATFHLEPDAPLRWELAELSIKLAVLVFSAAVVAQHAFRERRIRSELAETRAELQRLAAQIERAEKERLESGGGLSRFLAGLIYDLNARLMLIRGRAELLSAALDEDSGPHEDARGIAEAATALGRLGSDLLRVLKRSEESAAPCELAPLVDQVLNLMEFRLRPRRLRLDRFVAPDLPLVRVGAPHLQQALLELLEIAARKTRVGGGVSVGAERRDDEAQIRLRFEAEEEQAPPSPSSQRRLLEAFGAGVEALGLGRSCEYVVRLPLGAGARTKE